MVKENSCSNCLWAEMPKHDTRKELRECHRYAPNESDVYYRWPIVNKTDFCGDHKYHE